MATNVNLGLACPFAILAGSGITNTGSSVITGDVGTFPTPAITGFPPAVVVGGTIHAGDAVAMNAQLALQSAIVQANGLPVTADLTGQVLGNGGTVPLLSAGVYKFDSSAQLNGELILSGLGDFVFLIGSTLTTASASKITLIGGATANQIYWVVGSSATLGTGTDFKGNILATTSITVTTGSTVQGNLLARNGAVTLDTNVVNEQPCPVACPTITVNPPVLPNGTVGTLYNQTITQVGGTLPVTFSLTSGALPTGLLPINPVTGQITGTPTVAGTYIFTITVTDVNGCMGTRDYTVNIASPAGCPIITLSPLTLPNGTVGTPYSQNITASGGVAPYFIDNPSGAVPNGLNIFVVNAFTIQISGTPTVAGLSTFTIRATDNNGCEGSLVYTINILDVCPVITLLPVALLNGIFGVSYSQTITTSAGTPPITTLVTSGVLPAGLNLDPVTGIISGRPTLRGTFLFTITTTDINGCQGTRLYGILIRSSRRNMRGIRVNNCPCV